MLHLASDLKNFKLRAKDGDIGKVMEFHFDDRFWTVRYLVADTGGWLRGRQVLISPYALIAPNEAEQVIPVHLTKTQIEESPSLASDQPVSHQYETKYNSFYGWPNYRYGTYAWGDSPYIALDPNARKETARREKAWDHSLRSSKGVTGYRIEALDGEIGHIDDFVIDDENWSIRYLVVDTKNWWAGKRVLISPQWIDRVSWKESKVFANLSQEAIKQSPEFIAENPTRDYESALHKHYVRDAYWANSTGAKPPSS